jgi:hypothetical protein
VVIEQMGIVDPDDDTRRARAVQEGVHYTPNDHQRIPAVAPPPTGKRSQRQTPR